jgi:flagellar hook assembly protein FlgD
LGFLAAPGGTTTNSSSVISAGVTQTLLTWTFPSPLAAGPYVLTYQATVNSFLKAGITLDNCAYLIAAGNGPVSSCVSVKVQGDYTVEVEVYNEAGEIVKTILVTKFTQPIENVTLSASNSITAVSGTGSTINILYQGTVIGTWNGTTDAGNLATNGSYYIKINNIDQQGVVRTTTVSALVSRPLYTTTVLIYNEAGEAIRHLYAYTDNPGQALVNGIQLSNSFIEPTNGTQSGSIPGQVTITLSNGATLIWDGKSDSGSVVTSGQYFVEIHSQDGQGGQTELIKMLTVMDGGRDNGLGDIVAKPNFLTAANNWTVTFFDGTAQNLQLTTRVYTTAGELVAVPLPDTTPNQTTWVAQGLASGVYIAVIESRNAQGGLVHQKTLKIALVH